MNKMTNAQLYAAFIYAYSLNPNWWQEDNNYTWEDFVADSDHSFTTGVEVSTPDGIVVTISKEEAKTYYEEIKPHIEKFGLDEFYEKCFGYLYH